MEVRERAQLRQREWYRRELLDSFRVFVSWIRGQRPFIYQVLPRRSRFPLSAARASSLVVRRTLLTETASERVGKKVCKVEIGTEQEKLTMQLNGSQIFVEVLCEQGVDTIFGYPGGAVLNLYDEL